MKNRSFQKKIYLSFFSILLLLGAYGILQAAEEDGNGLDVAIEISNIDEKLDLIEELLPNEINRSQSSFVSKIRESLKGTDWIDPSRAIVFGMIMDEPAPEMAVLIPYQSQKPDFQMATNATVGQDYYVITLPPGSQQEGISESLLKALETASTSKSADFVTLDIALKAILEKGDEKIRQTIEKMDKPSSQKQGGNMGFTPEDLKEMVSQMVRVGKQLKALSESVDLTKEEIAFTLKATSVSDSSLSKLFIRGPMMTYLNAYEPDEQIVFRSGRYDIRGYMDLFGNMFGNLYDKAGINFSEMSDIMAHFTGEMAGGMSFSKDGVFLEMIGVLDEESIGNDFVNAIYLPWLEKYMQNVKQLTEQNTGQKMENLYVRTPDKTIEGQKVVGVKMNFPIGLADNPNSSGLSMPYEMRMTSMDRFFIIAPDDKRIRGMINMAKNLKEELYIGSLFKMDMDLGAYIGAVIAMAGGRVDQGDIPRTGKLHMMADAEEGRLTTSSRIRLSDIRALVDYSKKIAGLSKQIPKSVPTVLPRHAKVVAPEIVVKDADYWANKGSLCATYGNDAAAVKFYQKALAFDPKRSDVYFNLSVSYSEMGEIEKALEAVDKAISMDAENALYRYGRGRIYLKSGEKNLARKDFQFAAENGNRDAQQVLGMDD